MTAAGMTGIFCPSRSATTQTCFVLHSPRVLPRTLTPTAPELLPRNPSDAITPRHTETGKPTPFRVSKLTRHSPRFRMLNSDPTRNSTRSAPNMSGNNSWSGASTMYPTRFPTGSGNENVRGSDQPVTLCHPPRRWTVKEVPTEANREDTVAPRRGFRFPGAMWTSMDSTCSIPSEAIRAMTAESAGTADQPVQIGGSCPLPSAMSS